MLKIENLTIQYSYGNCAINNLTFACAPGEVLAILGESEAGKTSLLNTISGLNQPSTGTIWLNAFNIVNKSPKEINAVYLMGIDGLFKYKTVKANLEYPLKIRKIDKNTIFQRIMDVSTKLNLLPFINEPVYKLSVEQQIKILFARMLLREASIILVDNVFSLAHSSNRENLFLELYYNMKQTLVPTIFATDSVNEAFSTGDSILILRYGVCCQIGTPDDLCNNPISVYVDMLVNKNRNFISISQDEYELYKNDVKKFNLEYFSNNNVDNKSIIVSYELIEDENIGIPCEPLEFYYTAPIYVIKTKFGVLKANVLKKCYYVVLDYSNIRYYTANDEKRIY